MSKNSWVLFLRIKIKNIICLLNIFFVLKNKNFKSDPGPCEVWFLAYGKGVSEC